MRPAPRLRAMALAAAAVAVLEAHAGREFTDDAGRPGEAGVAPR